MFKNLLLVFIGGGLGSSLRFLFSLWINNDGIKWIPTLSVNVMGCLILGLCLALYEKSLLGDPLYLLIAVGFCGGLTTFSTFSLELFLFIKNTQYINALGYFLVSIVLGILSVISSYILVR